MLRGQPSLLSLGLSLLELCNLVICVVSNFLIHECQESSRALSERYPSHRTGLELRYYVVWLIPNHTGEEQLSGIHVGLDTSAYSALIRANQGVFEGLRWRRVRSLILARRAFLAEAERQSVDRERADHLFWWP